MWGIDIPDGFTIMKKDEPIMHICWGRDVGGVYSRWLTEDEYMQSRIYITENIHPGNITIQGLTEWLSTRTVPKTRFNIRELLKNLYKIPEYAPFEMCRLDHGVQYADFLWLKWDGEELCYNDVRLR